MYQLISEMPVPAEKVDRELFDQIPPKDYELSEMFQEERVFMFGLIRHFKPKNILEIGVSSGGGSGLILAAIEDRPDATLTSVDFIEHPYPYPNERIGFGALRKHSNNPQWKLVTGKDPSEVIEGFGKKFDFVVLDTAHYHPIETLNFLSVLPFLEDGAIVVLHDISLFLLSGENFDGCLATRYLFSSVTAERITPEVFVGSVADIGAFQVTSDTRKYIEGVFQSLIIPWVRYPSEKVLDCIGAIIKTYYPDKCRLIYENAVDTMIQRKKRQKFLEESLPALLKASDGKYILFGARNAATYLNHILSRGGGKPAEIWDNYAVTAEYNGSSYAVNKPHFDIADDIAIIFTVQKESTYHAVVESWPREFKERIYYCQL